MGLRNIFLPVLMIGAADLLVVAQYSGGTGTGGTTTSETDTATQTGELNPSFGEIFAIYFTYIVFVIIATFIIDKLGIFEGVVHRLALRSQSNLHPFILKERNITQEASDQRNAEEKEKYQPKKQRCECLKRGKEANNIDPKSEYKVEYLVELLDKPSYLATEPPTAPTNQGLHVRCGCFNLLTFPPGFMVSCSYY
jgi:hypothetical protein